MRLSPSPASGRTRALVVWSLISLVVLAWIVLGTISVAQAPTPITLGSPTTASVTTAGGSLRYSFTTSAGQRIFVQPTAQTNGSRLDWWVEDAYGRVIVSDIGTFGNLLPLGPVATMGGTYELVVQAQAGQTGSLTVTVDEPSDTTTPITLGQEVDTDIGTPGEIDTYTLDLAAPASVLVDLRAASAYLNAGVVVTDALGNVQQSLTGNLLDFGPYALPAGTNTVEVRSRQGKLTTYRFALVEAATRVDAAVGVDTSTTTTIGIAEQVQVPITVPATGTYSLETLSSTNLYGLNERLTDPDGEVVVDWALQLVDTDALALRAGTYTLAFRGEGGGSGQAVWRLHTVTDTTQALTAGTPVSTTVDVPGQQRHFTFTASAGEVIGVDVTASSNAGQLDWVLTDSFGRQLPLGVTTLSDLLDVALMGGSYTLTLTANTGQVGSATFVMVPRTVQTGSPTVGGAAVSGAVDSLGKQLHYTFTASAGQLLDVVTSNVVNSAGLDLRIIDAQGLEVLPRTTSLASVSGLPLVGGTYTLQVLPEGDAQGSFDLQLVDAGTSSWTPFGTAYTLGSDVSGNVSAGGGPDGYTLALAAPTTLFLDLIQGSANLDWALIDPAGRNVFAANATAYYADQGPFALEACTYTLTFSDPTDSQLAYRFAAYDATTTPAAVALEGTVDTDIGVPGEVDRYTLTLASDARVFVDHILGNANVRYAMDDASGFPVFPDTQALTGFGVPYALKAGTYTMAVRAAGGDTPPYRFSLRESTDTEIVGALDQEIVGSLPSPGSTVTYRFDVAADVPRAVLDLVQGSTALYWGLLDPEGRSIFPLDQAAIATLDDHGPLRLRAGSYRLVMDGAGDGVPSWRFGVYTSPEITTALTVGQYVEHPFTVALESRVWQLDLAQPRELFFDVETVSGASRVELVHQQTGWVAYAFGNVNTVGTDAGPLWFPAGTIEVRARPSSPPPTTLGFRFREVTRADRGAMPYDWVLDATVSEPGSTIRYGVTPEIAGDPITLDLMSGSNTSRWSLIDPVGTPVFAGHRAQYPATEDQGPFSLAAGTYDLVVDPDGDATPPLFFRALGPGSGGGPVAEPGCAACDELDIIFVFDTSSSMASEAQQMCDLTEALTAELRNQGIAVTTAVWGIVDTAFVPCATTTVLAELGSAVPGGPPPDLAAIGTCAGGGQSSEDWALATAVLADRYPWREGAVRLVVPLSDEGPYCGDGVDYRDTAAVAWAGQIATLRGVVVSPFLTAADAGEPVQAHGALLAQATGGMSTAATFDPADLLATVAGVVDAACDTQQVAVAPYLDQLSPPIGSVLPTGQPIVVSGHVVPASTVRPVEGVTLDGVPVDVFDGAGAFFTEITLQPGQTTFTLGIQQSCGSFDVEVIYEGGDPAGGGPVAGYYDVTAQIDDQFSLTSFPRDDQQLLGRVAAQNQGAELPGPLLFVVGADLDPTVTPLGTAGTLPTGEPYYEVVPAGQSLLAGATTSASDLVFDNPNRADVEFTRRWYAPANQAPFFTSAPPTRVAPQGTYTYTPIAVDPNGQTVTFGLEMAPTGMTLTSGTVSWTPGAGVEGSFDVVVRASDGAGGLADQRYVVTVGLAGPNRPPLFTTAPITQIDSGADYAYDARTHDADGDTVTYALPTAPAGMTVDAAGDVRWTGPSDGSYLVGLEASDGQGNVAAQAYTLTVGPPTGDTHAPRITSLPDLVAVVDVAYEYDAMAIDLDDDPLTWSLTTAPTGMTVDPATGVVSFTPDGTQLGLQPVTLAVGDGQGGQAEQSWSLDVRATAPNGTPYFVSTPVRQAEPDEAYTYQAEVVDPELEALTYTLVTAPTGMLISTDGLVTWTAPTSGGTFPVLVRATDPQGAVAEQGFSISVGAAPPPPGGIAFFTFVSPEDGSRVAAPVDVIVTVEITDGATIAEWDLVGIASGTGPLPPVLGTFDPTRLDNGMHEIELRIVDSFGRTGSDSVSVEVAGEMKLGSYDVAFLDATWSNAVTSLPLVRRYTTLRKDEVGDFGNGWTLITGGPTISVNGPVGEGGWYQESCGVGAIFAPICTRSIKPHIAVVRWPDGRVEAFEFEPTPGSTFFAAAVQGAWKQRPGASSLLSPMAGEGSVLFTPDGNLLGGFGGSGIYDPRQFRLTDAGGVQYVLDVDDGLVEMILPPANSILFQSGGIFPDGGASTTFVRDGQERITSMTLPDNSTITYSYDTAGDLVMVTDGEGGITRFVYDGAHRLTSYNVDGRPPIAQVVYDADGRVESMTDAGGVLVEEEPDTTAYSLVTTGPDPRLTTTTEFDDDGMIVKRTQSYVDPAGVAQALVEEWTYDIDYRMATHTLATGAVESWQYDAQGRVTQHVDAAGVTREWDYGPYGQVAESREGGEIVHSTTFDAAGLPWEVRRGDATLARRTTYDGHGLPLTMENGTGQVMSLQYDASLQLDTLTLPDFGGAPDIVDVTFDGRGQLLSVTRNYPGGPGTTSMTYDANGNQTSITDPLNHTMGFGYDELQRRTSYTDKLGRTVSWTYDESGRELTKTNRNSEVLTRTYDSAGRPETVTGPGVDKEFEYDALGREVLARSGDHTETRTYDGPLLVDVSASGTPGSGHVSHTWTVGMDDASRVQTLVGESQSVTQGYDSRGRLSTVTEATLGTFTFGYDGAGRRATLTRPSGVVTTTSFNDAGQTEAIVTTNGVGATVHEILTTYDNRSLPDTQTDFEGLHDYTHDVAGRLTGVDHPAGAAFTDEAYTYDAANRRTSSHRDPAVDVVYDAADKILQDADYTYSYDLEGRRTARTHRTTGVATTYSYNSLDQLMSLDEGGVAWTFEYDANDLRVRAASSSGYTESFVYDLNGLVRVTFNGSATLASHYVVGDRFGEILARVDGGGVVWYAIRDRLGTSLAWLDGAWGSPVSVARDAFGLRSLPPVFVVPFGFTGHAEDPTGLAWGRARMMDTMSGIWLSEDPVVLEPRYAYAHNQPSDLTDPDGRTAALEYFVIYEKNGRRAVFYTRSQDLAIRIAKTMKELGRFIDLRTRIPLGPQY